MSRLEFLVSMANDLDSLDRKDFKLAANAIDMALNYSSDELEVLAKVTEYANMLDLGNYRSATVLDIILKEAAEIPDERASRYNFKENNKQSLYRNLDDQPKLDPVEPGLKGMQGKALSMSTRYSPDFPGVNLLRISDGVYQDTMSRKVYNFNEGWVSESGEKYPGGSPRNQTPGTNDFSGYGQVFESKGLTSRPQ